MSLSKAVRQEEDISSQGGLSYSAQTFRRMCGVHPLLKGQSALIKSMDSNINLI